MVEQFFQSAVADVCSHEEAERDFTCFVLHAHRGRHYHDDPCPTIA